MSSFLAARCIAEPLRQTSDMGSHKSYGESLVKLGLSEADAKVFQNRKTLSKAGLNDLRSRLKNAPTLKSYPGLTIYAAGSFARGEASKHSDLDLFFIHDDTKPDTQVDDPHLKSIRVMSGVMRLMEDEMKLPPPSNDGQFLNIIRLSEMLKHLGGPEDDHLNHFTARMLLMLESASVFGAATYDAAIEGVIKSYLRDYEDHARDFRPIFLVNDVLRFWKTLCLNYEHKRNQQDGAKKLKQKIRNFKLGYSRLLTCFATVALLSSYNSTSQAELVSLCKLSPIEKLLKLTTRNPDLRPQVLSALQEYRWFLDKTALSSEQLESFFSKKRNRTTAFQHAKRFGDLMYEVVSKSASKTNTLRYLVI